MERLDAGIRGTIGAAGLAVALLLVPPAQAAPTWPIHRPDYPLPPASDRLLFYLQRSTNPNTVIYDARLRADGTLDRREPVAVYWRRYNTDGERRALNFAERQFAYGVSARRRGAAFEIRLVASDGLEARVFVGPTGRPRATTTIAGRPARLRAIYVEADDSGLWPTVHAVNVYGEDLATSAPLHERIVPRKKTGSSRRGGTDRQR